MDKFHYVSYVFWIGSTVRYKLLNMNQSSGSWNFTVQLWAWHKEITRIECSHYLKKKCQGFFCSFIAKKK